jgi:hypothetical protein
MPTIEQSVEVNVLTEPSPPPDEGTPPTPPPDEGTLPAPDPAPDDPEAD